MTEKRFVLYEHKGAEYILDEPNTELDFIEMLGDCLDEEEIVDLLNEQHEQIHQLLEEIEQLKQQIKDLRINVLDSLHEADEIQCSCNPCVVEECVKKVME